MRKNKFLAVAVGLVTALSLNIAASAAAAGPFWTVEEAAAGKTLVANPQFVDGGDGFGSEGSENLFDGDVETKYCAGESNWPFWAEWKYDSAVVADGFILATANDNEGYPRRMDDGWTLSGSNDGSSWTVIYTGKLEDYENLNFAFFRLDLPSNTTAYTHYRLYSEFGGDSGVIQLSEVGITGSAAAAPATPTVEETPAVDNTPAPATNAPAANAPAPTTTTTPAPRTADPILFVVIGSLISAAGAGVVIAKKRK